MPTILGCPLVILLQSFPASGSFPISQLFTSSGQSIRASASATALPVNIQNWFPLGKLAGLISLQSKGFWRVFSNFRVFFNCFRQFKNINSLALSLLHGPTLTSIHYWKNHSFDCVELCLQSSVLLLNMLSRFVIVFFPRSKRLLISWLQSLSEVILEPKNIRSVNTSTFLPSICNEVIGLDAMNLVFWMLSFKPTFSLSSFTFIKNPLVPLHFLPQEGYYLPIWGC